MVLPTTVSPATSAKAPGQASCPTMALFKRPPRHPDYGAINNAPIQNRQAFLKLILAKGAKAAAKDKDARK
nr:hypothetical protein BaRGS_008278 [Batillaria attramentaria]